MGRPAVLRRFVRCAAFAVCSCVFGSSAGSTFEMTSTLLVGGARIEVVSDRGSVQLPMEDVLGWVKSAAESVRIRSEEHTSELQSRGHLVCRLLLEKKKGAGAQEDRQNHRHPSRHHQYRFRLTKSGPV